jgi:hypothetical protein
MKMRNIIVIIALVIVITSGCAGFNSQQQKLVPAGGVTGDSLSTSVPLYPPLGEFGGAIGP